METNDHPPLDWGKTIRLLMREKQHTVSDMSRATGIPVSTLNSLLVRPKAQPLFNTGLAILIYATQKPAVKGLPIIKFPTK